MERIGYVTSADPATGPFASASDPPPMLDTVHISCRAPVASNASQIIVYEAELTEGGDGCYVMIPRGPPQLDGTIGSAGPYVVIQGAGRLTTDTVFEMKGAFRFEHSMDKLELQISATMRLGDESDPLFNFLVIGYLEIDWDGLAVDEIYPRELPDLFASRPTIVHGRLKSSTSAQPMNGATYLLIARQATATRTATWSSVTIASRTPSTRPSSTSCW